jgi:MFS family permease
VSPTLAAGIFASAVVALPSLLLGGLAVFIKQELGFGASALGLAVAAHYAAAAVAGPLAGGFAQGAGAFRTILVGLGCAAVSLAGIAFVANNWGTLVLFLMVGGVGNAVTQLGVNVLLVRKTHPRQQGLAYGAKQAAIPIASLMAGLAIPLIALTVGWRWAFAIGLFLLPLAALTLPRGRAEKKRQPRTRYGDAPARALVVLAMGVGFASAGGFSTAAFIVPSVVDAGFIERDAGLLLAVGSIIGILVRVGMGWTADRLRDGSLLLVGALVMVGAGGFAGLAEGTEPLVIIVASLLAFGGGWGFPGLVILAVARTNPTAPALAMGVVQMGPMAGAVFGPLSFGLLAENVSYSAAWTAMVISAVVGIITILVGRYLLLAGRQDARERMAASPS